MTLSELVISDAEACEFVWRGVVRDQNSQVIDIFDISNVPVRALIATCCLLPKLPRLKIKCVVS